MHSMLSGCVVRGGGEKKIPQHSTLYQSTGVNLNQVQGRPSRRVRMRDEQLLLSNDADDAFIPAARQWRDNSCYNVRGNLTSKPLSNMYHRVILLVLLAAPYANSLISLSDVGDIISFTHEVVIDVLQAWKLVSPLLEGEGPEHIDLPIIKNKEKKLLSKIAQVNRRYFSKLLLCKHKFGCMGLK